MIPKSLYTRTPVISRENARGVWAEGLLSSREEELTFDHAVTSFGSLLPPNRHLTGGQWVELIKRNYSVSDPRVAEVVQVVSRVMLLDHFKDDCILFDKDDRPIYRGGQEECAEHGGDSPVGKYTSKSAPALSVPKIVSTKDCSADDLYEADLAMKLRYLASAFPDGEFVCVNDTTEREDLVYSGQARTVVDLGLPSGYVYRANPGVHIRESLFSRVAELLRVRPVGQDEFSDVQNADSEATTALLAMLSNLDGYACLVTSSREKMFDRSPGPKKEGQAAGLGGPLSPAHIESSTLDFVESLRDRGWDGSGRFFLCRPAPCHNPLWAMRRHESYVYNGLIGWRVPQGYIQEALNTINRPAAQSAPRVGERA
jgi:hypothetical protein